MIDFTKAQQHAIGLDALDQDTCVVAGPGSGKTAVLIERFRGMVAAGISPLRILAITFTEKATSQMRERLTQAFADQPELVLQVQRAYVSTVHGFCTRLLRENAILAGVDPRFRVLNDLEASALQRKSADDSLDEFLAEHPEPVRTLLASLREPDLSGAVLDIYDVMRAAGMSLREVRRRLPPGGTRAALEKVIEGCEGVRFPDAVLLSARLRERRGAQIDPDDFRILTEFHPNLQKVPKQDKDAVKRLREELVKAAFAPLADEYFAAPRETFLDAIGRFDALYRSRKAEQSALDFSDLEEFSVRLLEENSEARERVRRQFDYILMDEFQDTNGLQSKLLDLLRPADRFFAVGDINQSIYGFRHADPEVFRAYRTQVADDGKRVAELRENWRSRADILKAVSSLAAPQAGIEPHKLIPGRKFSRKTAPSVEVICCLAGESDRAAELEAEWVASRISELHGSLMLESGATQFGDIAVLARKADSLRAFTAAFDKAGIPYAVTAGKGFFEAREVIDLGSLLRVLANPRDEISLATVLRSPLVGASDAALFELKQRGNFGEAPVGSPDPAIREFAAELAGWRDARHFISPERLLIRAMDRSGYELSLEPRQRANVEKFLALVRERAARQSLDDLVDDLERLRASDPREQDSAAEETGDAVRLMTIHSAKGLEFPVVFLAAMQGGPDTRGAPAMLSPSLGLGVRWRNPADGKSAPDSLYVAIEKDDKAREAAEANRLLYVGMTRAEEHLILTCSGTKKLAHWAGYLVSHWGLAFDAAGLGASVQSVTASDGSTFAVGVLCADQPPSPSQQLSLAFTAEAPALLAPPTISGQYDSSASVTSIALFADCPRRYYLARYLGWDGERQQPFVEEEDSKPDRDPVDSTEFGRQVHALLAGAASNGASPEALELAARFRSSEPGRRLEHATRIEREFDFLLAIEDVTLAGQIDLWFEESGALTLVDYKTDEVSADEVALRAAVYTLQLQLYALALERLTGRPPDQALLYFLRPDVAVAVDVSDEERKAAAAAVREFRQSQSDQRFPLREGAHCHRCPFFKGMCPAVYPFPFN